MPHGPIREFLLHLGDAIHPPRTGPPERLIRFSGSRFVRVRAEARFENGIVRGAMVCCQPFGSAPRRSEIDLTAWKLTAREEQIAHALLDGSDSNSVCRTLGISRETLKTHLRHLYQKTGTSGRTQLVAKVLRERSG